MSKGQTGTIIGWLLLSLTIMIYFGADLISSQSTAFVTAYNITGLEALILLNLPIIIIFGIIIMGFVLLKFGGIR